MAMTAEERKEKMEAIYSQIDAGIEAVLNTEKWQEYLKFQSRFYRYSFHNTVLILMQKPDASYVCGFHKWNDEFKRKVKKGASAIKILAPRFIKKEVKPEDGAEAVEVTSLVGFKAVNVFDVSQTEGEALPSICHELQGSTDAAVLIIDRLLKVIKIPVTFDYGDKGKGAYFPLDNKIKIKPNLSDNQSAKTMAHEYAHSLLHSGKCEKPRDLKEIEAESVAFIVCNYFGLETNEYSFEYLASWSHGRDKEEVKKLGMLIQKTAANIIDQISAVADEITYIASGKPDLLDTPVATTPPPIQEPDAKPPTKPGKKVEITIKKRVDGKETTETITAYTTTVPGLVINKLGKEWVVTHQATGFHVGTYFKTKTLALQMADLAPRTVDWTVGQEEIKASQEAKDYAGYTLKGAQPPKQKKAS